MRSSVKEKATAFRSWAFELALPLWSTLGTDRAQGGFFEKIDSRMVQVEEPRRARLVARQIYVFATAQQMGWDGPAPELVEHGLQFLRRHMLRNDFTIIPSVRFDGSVVNAAFDLYDTAFVLFGLHAAARRLPAGQEFSNLAINIRDRMIGGWSHPVAGFEECNPPAVPLKANPHMHLFEACLEWEEAAGGDAGGWRRLSDQLAALCLDRFIDRSTGALREFFDHDWRSFPGEAGRIVEPGHQFEWSWLLLRWAVRRGRGDVLPVAARLREIGEVHGVDPARGVTVNELFDDFAVKDGRARLWPQTERIKAWRLAAYLAQSPGERARALANVDKAITCLFGYIKGCPSGLWRETMDMDGSFLAEPSRASSLYHIMCALHDLDSLPLDKSSPR